METIVLLEPSLELFEEEEKEEEKKPILITCPDCREEREARKGAKRIRKNTLCLDCKRQRRKRKVEEFPTLHFAARMRSKYSNNKWKPLLTIDQVTRICEKYDNKCILTGEEDMANLTLVSFRPLTTDTMTPNPNELVLVTVAEARKLEKISDFSKRRSQFSPEMQVNILKLLNYSYTLAKVELFFQLSCHTRLDRKNPYREEPRRYRHCPGLQ